MDKQQYRLLVVDDNPDIHTDFKKILTKDPAQEYPELQDIKSKLFPVDAKKTASLTYEIDSALQGQEALQLVTEAVKQKKNYALAFVDMVMPPGWDGLETIKNIWKVDEDIQIVICTAYSDFSWDEIINLLGINDNFVILKKPFEVIEIRQFACCLTRKWFLGRKAGHKFDQLHEEVLEESLKLKKMLEKIPKQPLSSGLTTIFE